MDKKYGRHNFHRHTFCIFKEVDQTLPAPAYTSKSGSTYVFTDEGVYRTSNHWGRAANCKWKLEPLPESIGRLKTGFARWSDFHADNATDKLYCIIVDFEKQYVYYIHRDSLADNQSSLSRTAAATTKRIREIRMIFTDTAWMDYCKGNYFEIQQKIISQLITTDTPLRELKLQCRNANG